MKRGLLLAVLAGSASSVVAQQTFSTFTGGSGGFWSVPANWSSLNVPDSAGEVPIIPGGVLVNLNQSVAVDKIGIAAGGAISVNNGQLLGVYTQTDGLGTTGIFGGGTISLDAGGNATYLRLYGGAGAYAIHGASGNPTFIEMSSSGNAIIDATSAGVLFYNEGTIRGSGYVGNNALNLNNTGYIRATHAGGTLIIDPNTTMTNSGRLAAAGGTLYLHPGTYTQVAPGEIGIDSGTNSVVYLNGCTIIGGRLQSLSNPNEYIAAINAPALRGVTLDGQLVVPNGHLVYLQDSFNTTSGTLTINAGGNGTYIRLLTDLELTGTAVFQTSDSNNNVLDAQTAGLLLTNSLASGITMAGLLGNNSVNFVNNTRILARPGASALVIDPNSTFVNNGYVIAPTGSTLYFNPATYTNTNHFFECQPNAAVYINACTVVGGTLAGSQPAGEFHLINSPLLIDPNLTATTVVNTPNAYLAYVQGAMTNAGQYKLNAGGNGTYLRVYGGDLTLTGGGTILLSNSPNNVIDAQSATYRLLIQNQTIRGSGLLANNSLGVVNDGLVEASGSSGLTIDPSANGFDNNTVVRALTGSSLSLVNGVFDNSGGLLEVQDGASGAMSGCAVTAGTIRSLGSASWNFVNSNVFVDPTFVGVMNTPNAHINYWQGSVTNNGEYRLNAAGNATHLRIYSSDVVLSGSGSVLLTDSPNNVIDAQATNNRLTLQNHTIRGAGQLCNNSLWMVNNGLVEAAGSAGLVIDPPSNGFENNTVVRALTGSSVTFVNGAVDNTGALLEVQDGASGALSGVALTGGTTRSLGSGAWSIFNSCVLSGTTLVGTMNTPNAHINYWQGTITNQGAYNLNAGGNSTFVRVYEPVVTLTGGGTVNLSNSPNNVIDAQSTGHRLIVQNQTVRGSGVLGNNSLIIENHGTIRADQGNALVIDPPGATGFINAIDGFLQVQGAGGMVVHAGPFTTAGSVTVDPSRLLYRTSGSVVQTGGSVSVNGEIQIDNSPYQLQGGTLGGTGLVDCDVVNSGGAASPGNSTGTLTIEGNYTQQSGGALTIELGGLLPGEFDLLNVTGSVSLAGTLNVAFVAPFSPEVGTTFDILVGSSRTGSFSTQNAPGITVQYLSDRVRLLVTTRPCYPDVNCDGAENGFDVEIMEQAVNGDMSNFCLADPDFNRDGAVNGFDIEAVEQAVNGAPCPQ